jgi:DNA-binding beta-propeller fold protein YncE
LSKDFDAKYFDRGAMERNMRNYAAIAFVTCTVFAPGAPAQNSLPMQPMQGLLRLVRTNPLPIEGYIDHMAVDVKGQRLFICGEANKSLIVVDLRSGNVIHETKGLGGNPRKPFYLPDANEIWADLGDNTVVGISGTTYQVTKTVALTGGVNAPRREPDNAAYDPARHIYYAAVLSGKGTTDGSIEIVDTKAAKLLGSIKVNGSDPGGMSIEPSGKRLYVSMEDTVGGVSHVKVVDLEKRVVEAEWPITGGPAPHASGLDAAHHRLFIGSRITGGHQHEPGKLVVIDTETGKVVQALDTVGGSDEVQYDAPTGRIYFVGTTGTLEVFKQVDPDHYRSLGKVPTGAIAKTGLWVPELQKMYIAVPKHIVQTPPHGANDNIIEEAHLLTFEFLP